MIYPQRQNLARPLLYDGVSFDIINKMIDDLGPRDYVFFASLGYRGVKLQQQSGASDQRSTNIGGNIGGGGNRDLLQVNDPAPEP